MLTLIILSLLCCFGKQGVTGMNPDTLNRARMLEDCDQHLTEMPKHMLELLFQLTEQGYLF